MSCFEILSTQVPALLQVECRRTTLLEYFGEHFSSETCRETCDNCKNRAKGLVAEKVDVTEDCMVLLKLGKFLAVVVSMHDSIR
jgi:superfamily II DNA helicase RecQ